MKTTTKSQKWWLWHKPLRFLERWTLAAVLAASVLTTGCGGAGSSMSGPGTPPGPLTFNKRFPQIADALRSPADTVIDGEVVALDESGRPDFDRRHFTAEASRIHYFIFDLLVLKQRDLTNLPLSERRKLLKSIKYFS
jgi:bifunctional non-homologous end joining protein LigD